MGKGINMKTQGMSWLMKTGLVLLLTLTATVCLTGGWLHPGEVQAAAVWQATGTVQQGTGALTVAWPTHQTGDVALLFVETPNVAAALTTPNGFVEIANSPQATGTANAAGGTRLTVYWARATSAAMASPVLAAVANHQIAVILTFRGVRSVGNPFDTTAGSVKAAASTSTTFPSVTTTAANNLIVLAAAVDLDLASTAVWSSFTNAALTNITERFDQAIATGVGGGLGIATGVKATAGATGTSTGALTSSITTQMTISLLDNTTIGSCADCHGYKSPDSFTDNATTRDGATGTFRGSHNKHVIVQSILCSTCHIAPATETAADFKHSRGTIQMAASISGGTYSKASPFAVSNTFTPGTCSGTSCHANVYGTTAVASTSWGTAATGCLACHSAAGAIAATGPATGSHAKHATADCSQCHTGATDSTTVPSANHLDGNIDVNSGYPANVTKHAAGTYTGTCSTATCHVNVYGTGSVTTPVWGVVSGCTACHTTPIAATGPATGSHAIHALSTCSSCHAGTTNSTTTPTANHIDGDIDVILGYPANVTKHTTASGYGTSKCTTSMCHGTASPVWGANTANPTCQKCHSDSASATSSFKATDGLTTSIVSTIHVSHMNRTHSISTQVIACADCHTYPATTAIAGHIDTTLPAEVPMNGTLASQNAARSFNSGTKACTNVYCHGATTPTWTATLLGGSNYALDCVKCHGLPPATATHTGITVASIGELSKCSSAGTGCHPSIAAAPTTYANIFADKTIHINGSIEGGSCTGCHDTGGTGLGANRLAITPQFGAGYSHHYQGAAAVDGKVCYACHWESDSAGSPTVSHQGSPGGTVDLVIWNVTSRPLTKTDGTTSVSYTSGGASASTRAELAKINSHCIGCHSDLNKTTQPFSASGDTKTPAQYAWDTQSIGAKYLSTVTTPWGKFSGNFTNTKNTQTKALSAHNNAANNARGWSTLAENLQGTAAVTNFPNTSGAVAVLCFDCHNSHGSDLTGIVATTSYDSVIAKKGGILKQTTAGKGGYAVAYKPGAAGSTAEKNTHNAGAGLCFDCHNTANSGTATISGSTAPWGYTGTYGASQAIYGYEDTPYFGKSGGVFAKNLTYTYTGLTSSTKGNMKLNKGGHFGASSALITAPDAAHQIGGLCTPCHDPHGVSSTVSTPANAVPLLKGTYVTSPYKKDAAGTTQARGGGSKAPVRTAYIAGYHIDQNTMQAARSMKPTTVKSSWLFTTSAKTLQNLTDTQFAGLCINCHTKATLNNTAAATTANWKTKGRIHNSVAGWALTTGTAGNVGNKAHAYTCSKCHTAHNARLPRLLVTNCLDVKHVGRVLSVATLPAFTAAQPGTSGGRGRFPGGGGGAANIVTATNPGPWYFGSTASGSTVPAAATTCHQSGTAGGTTFNATSQQWNTKSLW